MSNVLHDEGNINSEGTPIHWNGSELKFEASRDSQSNTMLNIQKKPAAKIE
jgi:hypothetical protein